MNIFKTVEVAETYINTPVATYTFGNFIEFIRDNIDTWQTSPVIWDLTPSLLSKDLEPQGMLKELLREILPLAKRRIGARTAFVAARDYEFGMFRMLCAITECLEYPFELMVFRSLADAQAWVKG